MAYRPATSVTTSRTAPVPSFRAVTTAPGMPAFELSTTVPEMDPTDWANTGADVSKAATRINADTRNDGSLIAHLPPCHGLAYDRHLVLDNVYRDGC